MRTAATWTLVLALVVPAAAYGQDAKPPPSGQATQNTSSAAKPPPNLAPEEGVIPAPGEPPPREPPLPEPAIPPPRPEPVHRKRRWVQPVVIALEAGAVAFAVASITVISVGSKDDTWRYPTAGGLGGGVIVCAGVGIIIELVAR